MAQVTGGTLGELLHLLLIQTGVGWAFLGAALVIMFGGIGSAQGIRIAAAQGAGVLAEKPELFGRLFVLIAMPGTQGIYGLISFFIILQRIGLSGGKVMIGPWAGLALLGIGFGAGIVYWRSAVYQGETSAASISLVAKRPDQMGRSIVFPALVETYALFALLAVIMLLNWVVNPELGLPTSL
jgi:V/A-type H+-transporting ATPase subunit K